MKKEWGFVEKILDGTKTIESRWYQKKSKPWNAVSKGDTIYFKNSGQMVSVKADVQDIKQYSNLDSSTKQEILNRYGKKIGIDATFPLHSKKYCILIFLSTAQRVEPFNINKKGFGNMASWITVKDINTIKA